MVTLLDRAVVRRARSGLGLLGPAFVAAVAYVDPGNVATNVAAGAQYGFLLVWVVVVANLMACVVQYLSAKVGVVTGRSLPEVLRDRTSRTVRLLYWGQAELVAMATDLAEVVGGAIALNILFDLPILLGAVLTAAVSTALLSVQDRWGQRPFERVICGLLAVIGLGFVAGLMVAPPEASAVLGGLQPRFDGADSLLLAAGMLGATVMPHAVYVHSALARDRHGHLAPARRAAVLLATRWDVGAAMAVAGAINLAMLLVAATALPGATIDGSLPAAHTAVSEHLGQAVALLFAIGLLASGLASTAVGGYAGAVVMQGLLRRRFPLAARRVITLLPALVVIACGVDPSVALVLSQVVLSFGIPFALVPLVLLTARRSTMGRHVNHPLTTGVAVVAAGAVVALNVALVGLLISGG